eukprot:6206386-Pleurochrysis_carterae.AAC.2
MFQPSKQRVKSHRQKARTDDRDLQLVREEADGGRVGALARDEKRAKRAHVMLSRVVELRVSLPDRAES